MIVYFTGTGNSRWCAQRIAEKLDDACTDAFPYRPAVEQTTYKEIPSCVTLSPPYWH